MPLLGHQPEVADTLRRYAATLPGKPTAVLVVTAHWETGRNLRATTGQRHSLLFDYGVFPKESFSYSYPAPAGTAVAERVRALLASKGIGCDGDTSRGWDHGVFVPLMLMFPNADVPVVALSVFSSQDAAAQIAAGEALQPLRDEGVLIVGSGASFHNKGYIFSPDGKTKEAGKKHSEAFDRWLTETIESKSLSDEDRKAQMAGWQTAPSAQEAHPMGAAEHLMPLFTILGAAGGSAGRSIPAPMNPTLFDVKIGNWEFPP